MLTHKKIATMAGVSPATVSKALSHSSEISPETGERIRAIAREGGYYDEKKARRREYNKEYEPHIALLMPEIVSVFYAASATVMAEEVERLGGHASVYITGFEPQAAIRMLRTLEQGIGVDGVVTQSLLEEDFVAALPLVCIEEGIHTPRSCDVVRTDKQQGMRAAVEHLLALGHRRIGYIGEEKTMDKNRAFRALSREYALDAVEEIGGSRFERAGYDGVCRLLAQGSLPTALLTAYDEIAFGAIHELRRSGYRVPDDVSVVGINDVPFATYAEVPLTTVQLFTDESRRLAVQLVMRRIREPAFAMRTVTDVRSRLVVRETTAPPRDGEPKPLG